MIVPVAEELSGIDARAVIYVPQVRLIAGDLTEPSAAQIEFIAVGYIETSDDIASIFFADDNFIAEVVRFSLPLTGGGFRIRSLIPFDVADESDVLHGYFMLGFPLALWDFEGIRFLAGILRHGARRQREQ